MSEFEKIITKDVTSLIEKLFNNITKTSEFEFIFRGDDGSTGISYEKFVNIMNILKIRSKDNDLPLIFTDSLDINYRDPNTMITYRITIDRINNINRYMNIMHRKNNHIIYSVLTKFIKEGDKNLKIMKKTKDADNVIELDEVNIRVRLSEEMSVPTAEMNRLLTLSPEAIPNISYRFKNRLSLYVMGNQNTSDFIKIDLTTTKTVRDINYIEKNIPKYELEIEYGGSNKKNNLNNMMDETVKLLKIIQQTNFVITKSMSEIVLDAYIRILSLNKDKLTSLDARNTVSLEIQHVTEVLPNAYSVTDKADGERHALIIVDGHVYLISNTLVVKDTGIDIPESQISKYEGTILDGELIFISSKNRHIFLIFDCLFKGSTDVRKNNKLMSRLKQADEVIKDCFILSGQSYHDFVDYRPKKLEFDLDDILNFHDKQMEVYMNNLNKNIDINKKFVLVRRKYFIDSQGAKPWEIFAYSFLMYNKYTVSKEMNCPYLLDGLIYQPLDQDYNTSASTSKYADYKWKPPQQNSIDFFIQFVKDPQGKPLTIFDNSVDDYVKNKPYKICRLYVGRKIKNVERPVLFREEEEGYLAYLFLRNGEVRDVEDNIILDKTVVEFYYNDNPDQDEKFRWIPLRTRYDKTESVRKFGSRFGNSEYVAKRIYRSIVNPILMSTIEDLAKGGDRFENKMNALRSRISHELIVATATENKYYQLKTGLAQSMRKFHNWIKSNIIYTYTNPMYENDRQQSILDIGCGRGGDIMKFYYAKCKFLVGIDIDKETLLSAVDGARSRYNQMRKNKPGFPEMTFIHADAGALLEFEDQNRALGGMSYENKQLMERFFPSDHSKKTQFDRINCQFVMHYCFKTLDTWNNFKQNLNMYLKPGGFFLTSVFDGDRMVNLFKNVEGTHELNKFTQYYTNQKGEKKILFEIKKMYDNKDIENGVKLGVAIDLFAAWMFKEGQYVTEYLVSRDFLIEELSRDCGLELIDTDLFDNQYHIHEEFLRIYSQYDENLKTRKALYDAATFYERNEINGGCFKYTRLERYFIFRKRDNFVNFPNLDKSRIKSSSSSSDIESSESETKPRKSRQKGGNGDDINSQLKSKNLIVHDLKIRYYSYIGSIYHILQKHKLIPKTLTLKEFINDQKINISDSDIEKNNDLYEKINKNITIYHITPDSKNESIIKDICSIIVEKDCNNIYEIESINNYENNDTDSSESNSDPDDKKAVIFIYKEDGIYRPIYRKKEDETVGLFNKNDDIVKRVID